VPGSLSFNFGRLVTARRVGDWCYERPSLDLVYPIYGTNAVLFEMKGCLYSPTLDLIGDFSEPYVLGTSRSLPIKRCIPPNAAWLNFSVNDVILGIVEKVYIEEHDRKRGISKDMEI